MNVPVVECWSETGKAFIDTPLIDVNKSGIVNPLLRSRLVAKEINTHKRDDIFVATPLLEAKQILFSATVAENHGWAGNQQMKLEFLDVRRAFFHADARRLVYVKLLDEDYVEGMCGNCSNQCMGRVIPHKIGNLHSEPYC